MGPLNVGSRYEDDPMKNQQYKSVFPPPKDIPAASLKPSKNGKSFRNHNYRQKYKRGNRQ